MALPVARLGHGTQQNIIFDLSILDTVLFCRGMFTLGTLRPIITEPLPVPPLTLKGQAPPR